MSISSTGLISWSNSVTGTYTITVRATDPGGLSASRSFTLTVNMAANQAPTMNAIPAATITAPAAFSYQAVAIDLDGGSLAYTLSGNPSGMSISSTGLISWATSVAGTYTITVKAANPGGLSASRSFTLTVSPATTTHTLTITSTPIRTVDEGRTYTYAVKAVDTSGHPLTYSLISPPYGMSISSTGVVTWRPYRDGTYRITVKVSDGTSYTTQSYYLEVRD